MVQSSTCCSFLSAHLQDVIPISTWMHVRLHRCIPVLDTMRYENSEHCFNPQSSFMVKMAHTRPMHVAKLRFAALLASFRAVGITALPNGYGMRPGMGWEGNQNLCLIEGTLVFTIATEQVTTKIHSHPDLDVATPHISPQLQRFLQHISIRPLQMV